MLNIRKRLLGMLLGKPMTAGYKRFPYQMFTQVRDLPLFTWETIRQMLIDPTIRLGLAMRASPLYQVEFAYKAGTQEGGKPKWVPGVLADTPEVSRYVMRQLQRIWAFDLDKVLSAQVWGWSAGEVTYRVKDDQVHVDRLLERSAFDVLALRRDGALRGTRVQRIGDGIGHVDLEFPKTWWHSYAPECDSPYGTSVLKGAHSPWADKWLNGGALDVRRLFSHKDAYGGMDIGYPDGTQYIDGQEIPNRDIAREMAEQAKAGQVFARPSERDQNGNELWPINRAEVPANPVHIYNYPKDLDTEMLRGLEIPDDVLTSESTGAWQGKQVPMLAFYTSADRWLHQVVATMTTQLLEPLVMLNYGSAVGFEVQTKPLAEQAMEQMQQAEGSETSQDDPSQGALQVKHPFGRGRGGPPTSRFSLDGPTVAEALVGRGIVDAASLIEAGRNFLRRNGHNGQV